MSGSSGNASSDDDTLPAVYYHAQQIYLEMEKRSERHGDMIVYEGHLTKLFEDLRFSVPYYSKVTSELKRMGCIRQLRRGGGNASSQWELIKEPTEFLWKSTIDKRTAPSSKTEQRFQALEQQIRSQNERIAKLEASRG